MGKEVYIFGHKNPDTDSVCAAISLAYLKNAADDGSMYIPMTAGEVNSETAYVLDRFGVKKPAVATDIRKQVSDIKSRGVSAVYESDTVRDAWLMMNEAGDYTVPVETTGGKVTGILTIGDIARSYMNVEDKTLLAEGKATAAGIAKVLSGKIVAGSEDAVCKGNLLIAAAEAKLAVQFVSEGDTILVTGGAEKHKKLIEKGVGIMVMCAGARPDSDVLQAAKEKGVTVITTDADLYEAARFINLSLPVKYLMRPMDQVCGFTLDDYIDDIKNVIADKRYRDYPVMDGDTFSGMISKRSLLDDSSKKVIMVDHNEADQAVFGLFDAEINEIVDHHKLGTVETLQPISVTNMPWGSTCTIIASMYKEKGVAIPEKMAGLMCSAILSDTMLFKSPTCTDVDEKTAKELAEIASIDLQNLWDGMLRASLDLDSKTEKEIFYQDYKQFKADGFTFGAGQVLAANSDDVKVVKDRMLPYMTEALKEEGVDMVCLMITNVAEDSSELIYAGDNAKNVVESAFGEKERDNGVYLKGVMSRKKQLIPPIMAVLQK